MNGMQLIKTLVVLAASFCIATLPVKAQFPGGSGGSHQSDNHENVTQNQPEQQPAEDKKAGNREGWEMPTTELDLPVDESVHVHVDPFITGSVVDRLIEPSVIKVQVPDCTQVELFVVAVDSPYGGKALEKPRLIGKDDKPSDGWKVTWSAKEKSPYVKVFAVITKRSGVQRRFRSHTLDFGMAGARLDAPAGSGAQQQQPKPAATTGDSKTP